MLIPLNQALNERQKEAVTTPLGPTIVLAGPGSGKTHVIVCRIDYMIRELKCNPYEILVITFTRAAANEMKTRFMNQYHIPNVQFGTFHSVFYKMLQTVYRDKYTIDNLINEHEKKKIIENLYSKMQMEEYDDFVQEFMKHMSLMRNQVINPKYYNPNSISKENFIKLYENYEQYKEMTSKFDFDDMVVACYEELISNPVFLEHYKKRYKYILIDEFQDINFVQFEIIKLLAQDHQNVFIVGDDDQSIYKFRGAKPEFLLTFDKHFKRSKKITLDINYRSTENILRFSNSLIVHNKIRHNKIMKAHNPPGAEPGIFYCQDPKEQAALILKEIIRLKREGQEFNEISVIYRSNIEARPVMEALIASNIPFSLKDDCMTLYDQWITKDILAYLHLAKDLSDNNLVSRIINRPSRYISKNILQVASRFQEPILYELLRVDELSEWQKDPIEKLIFDLQRIKNMPLKEAVLYIRKNIEYDKYVLDYANYRKIPPATLMEVLDELQESCVEFNSVTDWEDHLYQVSQNIKVRQANTRGSSEGVLLSTMHSVKGLEFDTVFILNVVDGVIPHNKSTKEADLEEERRLLYVAMTRARKNLYLIVPKLRYGAPTEVSPFLKEIIEYVKNRKREDQNEC